MAIPGAHIRAGRGSEPVGRQGPELHQNVGTCMGLVGQLLSQNWCSQKNMLGTPPLSLEIEYASSRTFNVKIYSKIGNQQNQICPYD